MPTNSLNLSMLNWSNFRLSLIVLMFLKLLSCSGQKAIFPNSEDNQGTIKPMEQNGFNYEIHGEGDHVLLLIHGLGSNGKAWNKMIPYLKDSFRIYVIDLPKYLEVDEKSQVGITNYSKLLSQFLLELDASYVHVVGHSMGGQIAMRLAIDEPDLVESVTLLAPAGLEQFNESDREWFNTWVTKSFYLNLSDAAVKRSFDINFYGGQLPEDAQFMLDERLALKADSIQYSRYIDYVLKSINSMLIEPVYSELSMIKVPTLVLYGENDQLIPNQILHKNLKVEDVLKISNYISGSDAFMIDKAGHFIQWDRPQEVASKISLFINTNFTNE